MKEATDWLLGWFGKKGRVPGCNLEEQLKLNYFEAGLVDSLGVIELINNIEEYFGISFSGEHFQERRFSTIGGLSELIAELASSKEEESTDEG